MSQPPSFQLKLYVLHNLQSPYVCIILFLKVGLLRNVIDSDYMIDTSLP